MDNDDNGNDDDGGNNDTAADYIDTRMFKTVANATVLENHAVFRHLGHDIQARILPNGTIGRD